MERAARVDGVKFEGTKEAAGEAVEGIGEAVGGMSNLPGESGEKVKEDIVQRIQEVESYFSFIHYTNDGDM